MSYCTQRSTWVLVLLWVVFGCCREVLRRTRRWGLIKGIRSEAKRRLPWGLAGFYREIIHFLLLLILLSKLFPLPRLLLFHLFLLFKLLLSFRLPTWRSLLIGTDVICNWFSRETRCKMLLWLIRLHWHCLNIFSAFSRLLKRIIWIRSFWSNVVKRDIRAFHCTGSSHWCTETLCFMFGARHTA